MIGYLSGRLLALDTNKALVLVGGVGYQVFIGKKDLQLLCPNQDINFFIHTNVKEDAIELFGFVSKDEKQLFELLLSVSGIGPKIALGIVSAMMPHDIVSAVEEKDLARLSSLPGIGKKTAERLVLELKDKVSKLDMSAYETKAKSLNKVEELKLAIKALGYSPQQSLKAIASLDALDLENDALEILVKRSLSHLSGISQS
jgi:Holliday junction DNA helicase RuvA